MEPGGPACLGEGSHPPVGMSPRVGLAVSVGIVYTSNLDKVRNKRPQRRGTGYFGSPVRSLLASLSLCSLFLFVHDVK